MSISLPVQNREKVENVKELIKKHGTAMADLRFTDLFGKWQHFTIPAKSLLEDSIWIEGIGFDGSSIRGFQQIQESDMILVLDPESAFLDPVLQVPTIVIICDIYDPITKSPYSRDPRYVAKKAEQYLKSTGIADQSYWGPEMEFFLFNDVRYGQNEFSGYYSVDSKEGIWNSGEDEGPNLGYKIRHKEGYFPVPPEDSLQDLRSKMIMAMISSGIDVEVHHHEVATAGQCEIDMKYNTLLHMADQCLMYKYIVKNVAAQNGMTATFMPKPIFGDNGSGMHVHQSLWNNGYPIFFDLAGYAMLSENAKYYIGGLLKHAKALMALCAPTTNSYKRLVPGFEAPVNLVYSARNRSTIVRIPMYSDNPKAKRIEFRAPDSTANQYLAFSALLMAGLDGIQNKIDPGNPLEKNTYELSKEEAGQIKVVPGSLEESLLELEKDHEFLLKGNVFTKDILDTWIAYKREKEIDGLRLRPHPFEFQMYYDA